MWPYEGEAWEGLRYGRRCRGVFGEERCRSRPELALSGGSSVGLSVTVNHPGGHAFLTSMFPCSPWLTPTITSSWYVRQILQARKLGGTVSGRLAPAHNVGSASSSCPMGLSSCPSGVLKLPKLSTGMSIRSVFLIPWAEISVNAQR